MKKHTLAFYAGHEARRRMAVFPIQLTRSHTKPVSRGTCRAVSYTHLDVYKRQVGGRMEHLQSQLRAAGAVAGHVSYGLHYPADEVQHACLLYTSRCV